MVGDHIYCMAELSKRIDELMGTLAAGVWRYFEHETESYNPELREPRAGQVRKSSCVSRLMVLETRNRPQTRGTQKTLPHIHPDRVQIAFDDHGAPASSLFYWNLARLVHLP